MGNHKFRLSNIIPNGWFFKLKEMGITPKSSPIPTIPAAAAATVDEDAVQSPAITRRASPPLHRKSYHFSRKRSPAAKKTANSTPTPSSTTTTFTTKSSSSSVSAACSCRSTSTVQSALRSKPSSSPLQESASSLHSFDQMVANWSSASCHCSSNSPVPYDDDDNDNDDLVIGVDNLSLRCKTDENADCMVQLPPIRTDHKKFSDLVREIGEAEEQLLLVDKAIKHRKSSARRIPTGYGSPRVRLRIHSPKLSRRVENSGGRKSSSSRSGRRTKRIATESMAVVKSSSDPERDFKESMMEMIVENEIKEAKEMEELLACYLSLNSMEYHHLIVHVFQQIWFDLNHITL